ncbi:MAG: DUF6338 family protein [Microthrixaceae bacterium]
MEIPTSAQALIVVVLFVAPGLFFEQGVERCLTYWRTSLRDRLIRFLMWSVLLQVVLAPVTYGLWRWYRQLSSDDPGWVFVSVASATGLVCLIAVPFGLGAALGDRASTDPEDAAVRWLLGRDLAPRTWDHYFRSRHTPAWVRVRLTSGEWIAGAWAYASSYPETEDVALDLVACDPVTGEITIEVDSDGTPLPVPLDWQALITRDRVDLIAWQSTASAP